MMFLDCPAYLDRDGAMRCGLPAEVSRRFIMNSTDGPMESAMIRCPAGHWFNGPIEFLTWDRTDKHDPDTAAVASSAGRDSLTGSHDRPGRSGGSGVREIPAEPERDNPRPASAPAYYLGRPASLWITATRPGRGRTASDHPAGALAATDSRRHPGTAASSAEGHTIPRVPGRMPVPERRSA